MPIEDVAGAVKGLIQAGKVRNLGFPKFAGDDSAGARRAAGRSAAMRILAPAAIRPAREFCLCAKSWASPSFVGTPRPRHLTGRFNEFSRFDSGDRRASVPYFTPEALRANLAVTALASRWADRKGVTPARLQPSLANGPETLDRAHSGNDAAQPPSRESRRSRRHAERV